MNFDLIHNKIIKDTASDSFVSALLENIPKSLENESEEGVLKIQMYEDYISDNLVLNGEFYYPLTVLYESGARQRFIKWSVSEKSSFKGSPFAYKGNKPLEITLCDTVPAGFIEKISGRSFYFDNTFVPISLQTVSTDKTFLAGKYSQTFIDALAKSVNLEIEKELSVLGLKDSSLSLLMVFAPDTYMEHVVENVTYRRLLISAKGCSARDLWVKWQRRDSLAPATVSEHLTENELVIEIAEDVPEKIREREYRFLIKTSLEKYQSAMGRKNMTEWRELIKRMVKRGEVEKALIPEMENPLDDINARLKDLVSQSSADVSDLDLEIQDTESENDDIAALLRAALDGGRTESYQSEEISEPEEKIEEIEEIEEPEEEPEEEIEEIEEITEPEEEIEEVEEPEEPKESLEDRLRREIEEKLRFEFESKMREVERMREENERLAKERAAAEEERRLRQKKEEEERQNELRERERLAEEARLAIIEEQKRIKEEKERYEREERARMEAKIAEEEKRLKEEKERLLAEEKKAEAPRVESAKPSYTYTEKKVKLIFRQAVDPNVTKRIHEIILTTIKYYHKENVYMKIKATVPEINTVMLDFIKVPEEETQLIIDIINVLGRSNLGITKATLE